MISPQATTDMLTLQASLNIQNALLERENEALRTKIAALERENEALKRELQQIEDRAQFAEMLMIAKNMLAKGLPRSLIKEITHLSDEQLAALS